MTKLTLSVSPKVGSGVCTPQITISGLPKHSSGNPRGLNNGIYSVISFKTKKAAYELLVGDTHAAHEGHQEVGKQAESFTSIYNKILASGKRCSVDSLHHDLKIVDYGEISAASCEEAGL